MRNGPGRTTAVAVGGRASRVPGTPGEGGFTFIELLVALAILAFAFTYGVLHLDGATAPARLSSAARQVGSTVEFLRGHSQQAARTVEMEIDITGVEIAGVRRNRFRSVLPPRPSEAEADRRDAESVIHTEWTYLPKWIRIESVQVGANDSIETGVVTLRFSDQGEISPNGFMLRFVSDEIADPEEAAFSVEVNGLTGEVGYRPGVAAFEQVLDADTFR